MKEKKSLDLPTTKSIGTTRPTEASKVVAVSSLSNGMTIEGMFDEWHDSVDRVNWTRFLVEQGIKTEEELRAVIDELVL